MPADNNLTPVELPPVVDTKTPEVVAPIKPPAAKLADVKPTDVKSQDQIDFENWWRREQM